MPKRQMIEIDREKCTGCALCINACAEGALAIDDENKANVVNEIFCDGLGACLDVCPEDALKVVLKDTAEYDAKATFEHVKNTRGDDAAKHVHGAEELNNQDTKGEENMHTTPSACGCPGSMAREIKREPSTTTATATAPTGPAQSELAQWPIQLHLVSPAAPYFNESDILIAADCVPFALNNFHSELLQGKKVAIACPKLDDTTPYIEKLVELFKNNTIYSITVAIMSVPCCTGLYHMVAEAVEQSGLNIPVKKIVVGVDGEIVA